MNFSQFKLGRRPFVEKQSDLHLGKYLAASAYETAAKRIEAIKTPATSDWTRMPGLTGIAPAPDTDPLGNENAGCCVFAAPAHMIRMIGQVAYWMGLAPTRDDVIAEYARRSGYDPHTGSGDNGFVIRSMLGIWQREGLFGTKAVAYARVDPTDWEETAIANWLGCGLIGGYSLPLVSQDQTDATGKQFWHVPAGGFPSGQGPGSWGGHAIWSHSDSLTVMAGNSWGERVAWNREWMAACCDELWIVFVDAWRMNTGRAPNGFAWEDLMADVRARTA